MLLQVINEISDYSKLASGSFSINADIVAIAAIVTSVVRSERPTLSPGVHFELQLGQYLPKSVQGDPLKYRQVIQNLIRNAAKFTDRGSISVKVSVKEEDEDSYVMLSEVVDTGIGVSETSSANLFKPFTQLEETTRKHYQGTGLGLSISESLVHLMGGEIGHRPNPDRRGSLFWFTARFKKIKSLDQVQTLRESLRLRQQSHSTTPTGFTGDPDQQPKVLAPAKRVLVVEDNLINQKVLVKTLYTLGFSRIALAADGAEAVVMVCAEAASFDLLLMDINMPTMDGREATMRIRVAGIYVSIVAMTLHALKGDLVLCLDKGIDGYIPKPMERRLVVTTLLKWLSRRSAAVALQQLMY